MRELTRSYLTIVKDVSRVMNRLRGLYRSWAIPCAGRGFYLHSSSLDFVSADLQGHTLRPSAGFEA